MFATSAQSVDLEDHSPERFGNIETAADERRKDLREESTRTNWRRFMRQLLGSKTSSVGNEHWRGRRREIRADVARRFNSRQLSASAAACSIRVSTRAFVRIWLILRKTKSLKFFVFNAQQWCNPTLSAK